MGFGLRWRFRILPGLHLNVSKSGLSVSIGGAPLTINLGRKRIRTTASLPGTGLSIHAERWPRRSQDLVQSAEDPTVEIDRPPEDQNWQPVTPFEGYRFKYPPPPLLSADAGETPSSVHASITQAGRATTPIASAGWRIGIGIVLAAVLIASWLTFDPSAQPGEKGIHPVSPLPPVIASGRSAAQEHPPQPTSPEPPHPPPPVDVRFEPVPIPVPLPKPRPALHGRR